jgi:cytochrome c peroxidase
LNESQLQIIIILICDSIQGSVMLRPVLSTVLLGLVLAACGGSSAPAAPAVAPPADGSLSPAALLGQKIFSDPGLSASGRQSCASCHDPAHGHAQANDLSAQLGGPLGATEGFRAAPSLRYLNLVPAFHFAADGTPTGGLDRDGRAATLADQAKVPFLAGHEMANASVDDLVERVRGAGYAAEFRRLFGENIFATPDAAFDRLVFALQRFQLEDPSFHSYDSKYDQFLAGKVPLDAVELRGLALFNNPAKGNCAACHPSARGADGSAPLFTDFSYDNLGVPRNARLAATANPAYFDLGLCGPDRKDLATRTDLCGAFRVPTLRNAAQRKVFFHNGGFTSLADVVSFYVTRDTDPARWYPRAADGGIDKFNDLPPAYRRNVNTSEAPYNRQPGQAPALTPDEVAAVVKFLGTLTDGYRP